jgi:hypothetical protein
LESAYSPDFAGLALEKGLFFSFGDNYGWAMAGVEMCEFCEFQSECTSGVEPCDFCDHRSKCKGDSEE